MFNFTFNVVVGIVGRFFEPPVFSDAQPFSCGGAKTGHAPDGDAVRVRKSKLPGKPRMKIFGQGLFECSLLPIFQRKINYFPLVSVNVHPHERASNTPLSPRDLARCSSEATVTPSGKASGSTSRYGDR